MTTHPDWRNKRVLLLGFGEEGRANLHFAARCGASEISVADQAQTIELRADESTLVRRVFSGPEWLAGLCDFDIIMRSPGVPLRHLKEVRAQAPNVLITSGTEIFLQQHRDVTIGVTGTKGKSTTSSLIHHILTLANFNAVLGGNIGIPALRLLDKAASLYLLELSSYQLADIHHSPHIAVFLNLYPEHLDHHGDFQTYGEAKANIARFQHQGDRLILPSDAPLLKQITQTRQAEVRFWGTPEGCAWIDRDVYYYRCAQGISHAVCSVKDPLIKGPGNQRNILAALTSLSHLSIPSNILRDAIATFRPLPHRLETVGVAGGVTYVNDSISTVPEAAINALETFDGLVSTIILGGYDRGVSFDRLADYLLRTTVRTIIVFPPSGTRILQALRQHPLFAKQQPEIIEVSTMEDAVHNAAQRTPVSTVCLLSPASPSFPLFKNFEERGALFREEVLKLSQHA